MAGQPINNTASSTANKTVMEALHRAGEEPLGILDTVVFPADPFGVLQPENFRADNWVSNRAQKLLGYSLIGSS